MRYIKLFFIQAYLICRLFFGKLEFAEPDEEDGKPSVAKKRLGITELEVFPESGKGQDELEAAEKEAKEKAEKGKEEEKPEEEEVEKGKETETGKEEETKVTEGKVKLGDKEIDEKEFNAIYESVKKDLGDDFESLSPAMKEKLLVKEANIKDGSREIAKKNQRQAAKEKELTEESEKLKERRTKLTDFERDLLKEEARLKALVESIDPDIEDDEDKRIDLKLDKKEAERDLKRIEKTKKDIDAEKKRIDDESNLEIAMNAYVASKEMLLTNFPEDFKTEKEYEDINDLMEEGKLDGDDIEAQIVMRFKKIYEDYYSHSDTYIKNNNIVNYYKAVRASYPVIPRGKKETEKPVEKKGDKKSEKKAAIKATNAKELFNALVKKQKGTEEPPPSGNGAGVFKGGQGISDTQKKYKENAASRLIGKREVEP